MLLAVQLAFMVLFLLLRTVCILAGLVIVPLAVLFKAYTTRKSKYYDRDVRAFTWKYIWLWGNEEEGIGWYDTIRIDFKLFKWEFKKTIVLKSLSAKIIYSECMRNPANNLRYVPYLSLKIEPSKVQFKGSPKFEDLEDYDRDEKDFSYFAWQGLYSCIRWQGKVLGSRRRFWLGFKLYPGDVNGLPEWSHRNVSAGFATQFKKLK